MGLRKKKRNDKAKFPGRKRVAVHYEARLALAQDITLHSTTKIEGAFILFYSAKASVSARMRVIHFL